MSTSERYAIRVIWANGDEGFLVRGICSDGPIALFPSREVAEAQKEFLLEGIGDEVQSVSVVRALTEQEILLREEFVLPVVEKEKAAKK